MSEKKYVVVDTETTGLLKPAGTALELQPHIIEIYGAALNEDFEIVDEFESLVRPPIPIPEYITKHVNGISDEMVANSPKFMQLINPINNLFQDCETFVAANASFDKGVIKVELQRTESLSICLFPPQTFCTIEQSMYLRGYRLKNSELYKMATGRELVGAHRAKADVMATIENLKFLKKEVKFSCG